MQVLENKASGNLWLKNDFTPNSRTNQHHTYQKLHQENVDVYGFPCPHIFEYGLWFPKERST